MALLEHLEKWNKLMPYKICEPQLRLPDEYFIINCLTCIFEKINKKIPHGLNSEDPDVQVKSKLKLCHTVSSLYKLSDEKNGFFYTDLIHPTPKRTLHLMQNLLNYVLFYIMMHEETEGHCKEYVDKLKSLNGRITNRQIQVEELKEEAQEPDHDIETKIQTVDAEIINEKVTLKAIDQKLEEKEKKLADMKEECQDMQGEIERIREEFVPKESLEKLEEEYLMCQQEINGIQEIIFVSNANNEQNSKENEKNHELVGIYEDLEKEFKQCLSFEPSTDKKGTFESHEGIEIVSEKKEIKDLEAFNRDAISKEKDLKKKISMMQEECKNMKLEHENDLKRLQIELETKNAQVEEKDEKNKELEKKLKVHLEEIENGIPLIQNVLLYLNFDEEE